MPGSPSSAPIVGRLAASPARLPSPLDVPAGLGDPAEVGLQHLADVHPAGHAERVEHDVDRGAVLEERHVLDRQDLGDDALVAVPAGELVAVGDLALLGDVDADQLVDARRAARRPRRGRTRWTPMTLPDSPCGTFSEVSRTSRAFSPKIARSRRSSGVSSVSPLGVTLPTRMSPGTTSAPMRMMPRSSRSARTSSETFGMSRVISSAPSLVSRASTSCSSMWIEERTSSCTRRWTEDDRVLVVVALPRHERHEQVAPERHLAVVGARTVGDDLADLDPVALVDDRLLVERRALVGAAELRAAGRSSTCASSFMTVIWSAETSCDHAGLGRR